MCVQDRGTLLKADSSTVDSNPGTNQNYQNFGEEGLQTYIGASHQGATEMFWLHCQGDLELTIFTLGCECLTDSYIIIM